MTALHQNIILIFDKQEITRAGLKYNLQNTESMNTSTEAANQNICCPDNETQLVSLLMQNPQAIVYLDYTMMNSTPEQLLVMHQRFPQAHFVLFCDNLSKDFARRMMLTSTHFHILLKDSTVQEVKQAHHDILHNRQYLNTKLITWIDAPDKKENTALTQTEKEILKAISLGKTTKEIASERFSSVYTIMTHRKNIFRKLNVNNAQEAIRYAVQTGIVDVMEYYI